jgi:hypothetical protein
MATGTIHSGSAPLPKPWSSSGLSMAGSSGSVAAVSSEASEGHADAAPAGRK